MRRSTGLSEFLGGDVWLKLECTQVTGSFKIRGATNVLASLDASARAKGVVTASSGNHGLGIATAARELGVAATVYLPRTAPAVKRDRIAALGATVDASAANYDAAESLAKADAARGNGAFVSPCTGATLLAGQGTVALEILDALPTLRTIVVPVGGSGLVSGIAGLLRAEAPGVRIIGAQSDRTNAMALALAAGRPTDTADRETLADGLSGRVDATIFAQGREAIDAMVVASEEDLADAIAFLWMEEGVKVEGAGAAGVAALLAGKLDGMEFPIAIVISGGNIDEAKHQAVLDATYHTEVGDVDFLA